MRPSAAAGTPLKKGTFVTVLVLALASRSSRCGDRTRMCSIRRISVAEAEAKRPINAWKPFGNGQRACIGRGFAMHEAALAHRHDPAALQADRSRALPDGAEGDADDQAGRLQDQSASAQRQRTDPGAGTIGAACGGFLSRTPGAGDAAGPQHAAAGAVRLQPRLRRRACDPHGGSCAGQRLCDKTSRRSTRRWATCRPRVAC